MRNISAPFLNALDDKQQVVMSRQSLCRTTWFTRGKHDFWVSKWFHQEAKREHIRTLKKKNTPKLNTTTHMYIYIYTQIHLPSLSLSSLTLSLSLFLSISRSLALAMPPVFSPFSILNLKREKTSTMIFLGQK